MLRIPYATVSTDARTVGVSKELTYSIPTEMSDQIRIGSPVLVPLQTSTAVAFVTDLIDSPSIDTHLIKPILRPLSDLQLFDGELLKMAYWIANYYHCELPDALRLIIPPGWDQRVQRLLEVNETSVAKAWLQQRRTRAPKQASILETLMENDGPMAERRLQTIIGIPLGSALKSLIGDGLVRRTDKSTLGSQKPLKRRAVLLTETGRHSIEGKNGLSHRQLELLHVIKENSGPSTITLLQEKGFSRSMVETLVKRHILQPIQVTVPRKTEEGAKGFDSRPANLNEEQQLAHDSLVKKLDTNDFGVVVLQGVTASGKTEVYLRAIEHAVAKGKQAICLVPEIALTAQTAGLFKARFGDRVAILHSALSRGARFEQWQRVRDGHADVVVGARSAIFAPCRRLGLVVIDEEQDESYKQDATPRYHARDAALIRARWNKALVILGSATPSIETYYKASLGHYHLITLKKRVDNRPLPDVHVVDMLRSQNNQSPLLSDILLDVLVKNTSKGEQSILFLNRRGFANFLLCKDCGNVEMCINCDVSLTYHQNVQELICHHCNFRKNVPHNCSSCNGAILTFRGSGTEKVETELKKLVTNATSLRMDRDTTSGRGAHARLLTQFRRGDADVLIGTQMVTKGLDFPNVTTVGVLNADASLNFPDFRAAERTFQLITQVAGRAGRGERPGDVYVQTYNQDHYAVQCAIQQNFQDFFNREIQYRRQPTYPPFAYIVNVIATTPEEDAVQQIINTGLEAVRKAIKKEGASVEIVGPAPCLIPRLRGNYRWHFFLRSKSRRVLNNIMKSSLETIGRDKRKHITVDVDPVRLF